MPTFDQMQTLVAVVQAGTLKEAAQRLFVAPATISVRLNALEKELGKQLVVRTGKSVQLTESGEQAYQIAVEILSLDERLLDLTRPEAHPALQLGSGNTIGTYLVPRLISRFRNTQHHIKISVDISNSQKALAKLSRGVLDAALVSGHVGRGPFAQLRVFSYQPLVIFPPGHPIGQLPSVNFRDVASFPLIVRERGSLARREVDTWFKRALAKPNIVLELNNVEAVKVSVQCGLGLAFASPFTVQSELRFGLLGAKPLTGFDSHRAIYLAWDPSHRKSQDIADLIDFFSSPTAAGIIAQLGAVGATQGA